MIHNHYEPSQILWFLRNYWRFTRDGMIVEWNRAFKDSNFGKSQYQWLKSRYGMKLEWGASLNHPPYAGARPGGPGTENWVPPEIPTNPPRATFRTRSDSPTPGLTTNPVTVTNQNSKYHTATAQAHMHGHSVAGSNYVAKCGPGFGQIRRSSAGSAYVAGKEYFSTATTTTGPASLSTPMMTTPSISSTGSGTYDFSNNANRDCERVASRGFSGSMNPSHGTYSFCTTLGSMTLASPFMPSNATMMNVSNPINPIVSSFAADQVPSTPNLNCSLPLEISRGMNINSPQLPDLSSVSALTYGGSTQQAYQYLASDLSDGSSTTQNATHNATKNSVSFDAGLAGLGINHGATFFPMNSSGLFAGFFPDLSSSAPADESLPEGINCSGSQSNSEKMIKTSIPSNAKIIASVMRSSSPVYSDTETSALTRGRLGLANAGSKRKRSTVEVSFQPPKRAKMATHNDQADMSFHLSTASEMLSGADDEEGKLDKYGPAGALSSQTSVPSSVFATPLATPFLAPTSLLAEQSRNSPSTEEAQEQVPSTIEVAGTWYHGLHRGCYIDARHCHGNSGSILFSQNADFEKAAFNYASRMKSPAVLSKPAEFAACPLVIQDPVTAKVQVSTSSDMSSTGPADGPDMDTDAGANIKPPAQGFVQTSRRAVSVQSQEAVDDHSKCIKESAAAAAGLEDYEYKVLYHVGASLSQSKRNLEKDTDPLLLVSSSTVPGSVMENASSAPETDLLISLTEAADDFSSMANFEEDFDLNQSSIDAFSDSDRSSSNHEATK
ncbi:hypothetical protein SEPCBS119000_000754 [Sporothrix epigloea]|uniref:Uncharacterized protein n=1 Tax=Sporothrix epigloea TaxID=1892477 RepID=A0ABP0D810_9PEZI